MGLRLTGHLDSAQVLASRLQKSRPLLNPDPLYRQFGQDSYSKEQKRYKVPLRRDDVGARHDSPKEVTMSKLMLTNDARYNGATQYQAQSLGLKKISIGNPPE